MSPPTESSVGICKQQKGKNLVRVFSEMRVKVYAGTGGQGIHSWVLASRGQHSPLTTLGLGPSLALPRRLQEESVKSLEGGSRLRKIA